MPKSATQTRFNPLTVGLVAILGLAIYRAVLLWFSTADLFMDESQYWLWGQELDWGYYSKPPMIGWVLRAATELAGSDAIPVIRLPMVLLNTATAIIVMLAARQVTDPLSAALCGVVYATCPFTTAGSFLVSTDSVLAPFFALSLLCYLKLSHRSSMLLAVALGVSLGVGMLAKYAAIYFLIGAALGMLLVPSMRLSARDICVALLAFCVVIVPNVVWNLQNDLTTLSHTADNVDWINDPSARLALNWDNLGEFLGGQFLVFGPIFFAAYLWASWRAVADGKATAIWLLCMSAPILALVSAQALLSKAYANWAVMAYLPAILLTIPALWQNARWLVGLGLALNIVMALAVPALFTQATTLTYGENDRLVMRRFVGRTEMSRALMDRAEREGITTILSSDRNILADLFYETKGTSLAVFAVPPRGAPAHYYAQDHAFQGGVGTVMQVSLHPAPPACEIEGGVRQIDVWDPAPGAYERDRIFLYAVRGDCLTPP